MKFKPFVNIAKSDIEKKFNESQCKNFNTDLPEKWQGISITWEKEYLPIPVLIEKFNGPFGEVFLFGIKLETKYAKIHGKSLPDGHFITYLILEEKLDKGIVHQLAQRRRPDYSPEGVDIKCVDANDVNAEQASLAPQKPKWKKGEGLWPKLDEIPLFFLGQLYLPNRKETKEYLTYDKSIYLFWLNHCGNNVFSITAIDEDLQTSKEHYDSE